MRAAACLLRRPRHVASALWSRSALSLRGSRTRQPRLPLSHVFSRTLFSFRHGKQLTPAALSRLESSLLSSLPAPSESSPRPLSARADVARQLVEVYLAQAKADKAWQLLWQLSDEQTAAALSGQQERRMSEQEALQAVHTLASIVSLLRTAGLQGAGRAEALDELVTRSKAVVQASSEPQRIRDSVLSITCIGSIARCLIDLEQRGRAVSLLTEELLLQQPATAGQPAEPPPAAAGDSSTQAMGSALRLATAYNLLGMAAYAPPQHQHSEACAHDGAHHHHDDDISQYDWTESEKLWQTANAHCEPFIHALTAAAPAAVPASSSTPSPPPAAAVESAASGLSADVPASAAASLFSGDSLPLHLLRCAASVADNLAAARIAAGRQAEAVATLSASTALLASLLPPSHPDLLRSELQLTQLLLSCSPPQTAAAVSTASRLLLLPPSSFSLDSTGVLDGLASLWFHEAHWELAGRLFALVIAVREAGGEGEGLVVASRWNDCGMCELRLRRWESAEQMLRRSLQLKEAMLGAEHHELAVCVHNLATALLGLHRYTEAEAAFKRAERLYADKFARAESQRPQQQQQAAQQDVDTLYAILHAHLGQLYAECERWPESVQRYRQAMERRRSAHGEAHPALAMDLSALAAVHLAAGQAEEALLCYRQLRDMSERLYGAEHVTACQCRHWAAAALWKAGRREEAIGEARQAVELAVRLQQTGHELKLSMMDELHRALAMMLKDAGKEAEAEAEQSRVSTQASH